MSSLRDAVRDKLREDKVKLWLPPYDTSDALDALAKTYAGVLQASEQDVAAHLADLRQSALAKLAQRTLITLSILFILLNKFLDGFISISIKVIAISFLLLFIISEILMFCDANSPVILPINPGSSL